MQYYVTLNYKSLTERILISPDDIDDKEVLEYLDIKKEDRWKIHDNHLFYDLCDLLTIDFESLTNKICKRYESKNPYTKLQLYKMLNSECENLGSEYLSTMIEQSYNGFKIGRHTKEEFYEQMYFNFGEFILIQTYFELFTIDNRLSIPELIANFFKLSMSREIPLETDLEAPEYDYLPMLITPNKKENKQLIQNYLDNLYFYDDVYHYECNDNVTYFLASLYYLCKHGFSIGKCENCGKYFVAYNRSDTIYCDRSAPQDNKMTCKEYGSNKLWYEKMKNDEALKLCRNITSAKQMKAKRYASDVSLGATYKNAFENFKIQSKKWKENYTNKSVSSEEFIAWLKAEKERKY